MIEYVAFETFVHKKVMGKDKQLHDSTERKVRITRYRHGVTLGVNEKKGRLSPVVIVPDTDARITAAGHTIIKHFFVKDSKQAKLVQQFL